MAAPRRSGVPDPVSRANTPSPGFHLFSLSDDLICAATPDGYFQRVNPAFERVLGWNSEFLLTTPFLELVHPEDQPDTQAALRQLGDGQNVVGFSNRYRTKSGDWVWIKWKAYVDPNNGPEIYATGEFIRKFEENSDPASVLDHDLETTITRLVHRTQWQHDQEIRARDSVVERVEGERASESNRADVAESRARTWQTWIAAIGTAVTIAGGALGWAVKTVREGRDRAVEQALESERIQRETEADRKARDKRVEAVEDSQGDAMNRIRRLGVLLLKDRQLDVEVADHIIENIQTAHPRLKTQMKDKEPRSLQDARALSTEVALERELEKLFEDDPPAP